MKNFLLDGTVNPSPAPLLLQSTLREWARSNCPRSPCCNCCCASFPSAMFALTVPPAAGWKPFLKPPISRRNFCCWSELSKWAVPHWPKPWETETTKNVKGALDLFYTWSSVDCKNCCLLWAHTNLRKLVWAKSITESLSLGARALGDPYCGQEHILGNRAVQLERRAHLSGRVGRMKVLWIMGILWEM